MSWKTIKCTQREFTIDAETCDLINRTRRNGKRIIAVGTTSCRVLESLRLDDNFNIFPEAGSTDMTIYPGL